MNMNKNKGSLNLSIVNLQLVLVGKELDYKDQLMLEGLIFTIRKITQALKPSKPLPNAKVVSKAAAMKEMASSLADSPMPLKKIERVDYSHMAELKEVYYHLYPEFSSTLVEEKINTDLYAAKGSEVDVLLAAYQMAVPPLVKYSLDFVKEAYEEGRRAQYEMEQALVDEEEVMSSYRQELKEIEEALFAYGIVLNDNDTEFVSEEVKEYTDFEDLAAFIYEIYEKFMESVPELKVIYAKYDILRNVIEE